MALFEGSLSREKLRDLRSLDSAKIRKRKGLCVVEGERALAEAARKGSLLYLVRSDARSTDSIGRADEQLLSQVPCYALDERKFREISDVRTGSGLLGAARIPPLPDHDDLKAGAGRRLFFYLDGIQEPGNVGALIRTAWALGFDGVMLGEGTADPFSHKGVRGSAGGVFHLPLYGNVGAGDLEELQDLGYGIFVAQKGGYDYRAIEYQEQVVLVLGNEGAGPSETIAGLGTTVGIPLAEGADSLNVVVAGGIIASRMIDQST